MKEALDRLPPKCREVFLMIKLHGLTYKQAAEQLEISVKTVENQMGKAIKILRDMVMVELAMLFIWIANEYGPIFSFTKVMQQ